MIAPVVFSSTRIKLTPKPFDKTRILYKWLFALAETRSYFVTVLSLQVVFEGLAVGFIPMHMFFKKGNI
jgi:hypothetical protein